MNHQIIGAFCFLLSLQVYLCSDISTYIWLLSDNDAYKLCSDFDCVKESRECNNIWQHMLCVARLQLHVDYLAFLSSTQLIVTACFFYFSTKCSKIKTIFHSVFFCLSQQLFHEHKLVLQQKVMQRYGMSLRPNMFVILWSWEVCSKWFTSMSSTG